MGLFDKFRRLFSKAPKAPKVRIRGHRGVAMGSRQKPDLEAYRARLQQEHEKISEDETEDFLAGGNLVFVHSSNVVAFQWFPEDGKMMVEYGGHGKRSSAYLYSNVTQQEAQELITAQSKGSAIWDLFRVRGSRTAHKKPYSKLY